MIGEKSDTCQADDPSLLPRCKTRQTASTLSSSARRRVGEQFFGVHDVLEQLTQKVAIARDEGRLAEEAVLTPESQGRELPERLSLEQTTLECAEENPSDLGTKVPESEARSDRVSRLEVVAVTSRFAV